MDFLSQKALTIAVGVSISLTITSAILFTLNQIMVIYKGVYTTDVSVRKQFNEYSMYQGTVMTGLEMCNTAKKYKDSRSVNIRNNISGVNNINTTSWVNSYNDSDRNYTSRIYDVTYSTDNLGIVTIVFKGR